MTRPRGSTYFLQRRNSAGLVLSWTPPAAPDRFTKNQSGNYRAEYYLRGLDRRLWLRFGVVQRLVRGCSG